MSKNDAVWNDYYSTHLNGGRKQNRAMNTQAATEQMYVRLLTELCANRFEWKGFPDSINKRFLELNLIWRGMVAFYYDQDAGQYFVAQGSGSGATNFMDEPTALTIIGPGMLAKTLSTVPTRPIIDGEPGEQVPPECVPIFCNFMRTPDLDVIYLYATKLAKLDRSIEITADNMRKTKVVTASENERLSALNALKQIAEGQEAILVNETGATMVSSMQVLDLGVDALTLPNLQIAKSKMWNEVMGLLGINNANQDKKERLVAAEVGANDEQVQATKNIALNARRFAAEQINQLYGLNVSVDFVKEPDAGSDENSDAEGKTEKDVD